MREETCRFDHSFFQNRDCEYFPCHETAHPEEFSCLFCYCPLYALGEACKGNFRFTEKGEKDCSACLIPHKKSNYEYIVGRYGEISELAKANCPSLGCRTPNGAKDAPDGNE